MRLLITASTLPRWRGDSMPNFVLDQVRALVRHDPALIVRLLVPHDAGALDSETIDGIEIRRFRYFWPANLQQLVYPAIMPNLRERPWLWLQVPFLIVSEIIAVFRETRRFNPDVIYSHWFMPQALAGTLVARWCKLPHVFTSHSADVYVLRKVPILGPWLVRNITRHATAITAVSSSTRDKLQQFFSNSEWLRLEPKIKIIPMGVDTVDADATDQNRRANARANMNIGEETVFLFMGRLSAKKGLYDLLRAASILAQSKLDFSVLIAGDGELRDAIEQRISDLGLGARVIMLGFVTGDVKQQSLDAADVLVVPSIVTADGDAEGLPVSLLEGLAAGKLCVATSASGAEDVLTDGKDGWLVADSSPGQLADALNRAATMTPEGRSAMAANARLKSKEFDWSRIAEAHFQHLFANQVPTDQ